MFQVLGVSKAFGGFVAVRNLSFEVRAGEIFGLLGENGAGKTTTLRMLATVLAPSSGEILLDGLSVTRQQGAVRRMIGVIVGDGVYDRLTVRENLEFHGRTFGLSRPHLDTRISSIIEQVQLGEYANKWAGHLSKGNKQKLSIGRALVHDPPVLIMDEPMSGLDVGAQQIVRSLIQHLRSQGKTIVFSTHNMSDVDRLCDRVAVISKGDLRAYGDLREVVEDRNIHDIERLILSLQAR